MHQKQLLKCKKTLAAAAETMMGSIDALVMSIMGTQTPALSELAKKGWRCCRQI
jgi:hypothetical protein